MNRFKNKTLAVFLAAVGGTFGLHRFYLQGTHGWKQYLYPAFCFTLIPTFAGFIEALMFAVTPDEKWDATWNPGSQRKNDSGWTAIIIAILTLALGATLLMSLLAIGLGHYFGAGESLN